MIIVGLPYSSRSVDHEGGEGGTPYGPPAHGAGENRECHEFGARYVPFQASMWRKSPADSLPRAGVRAMKLLPTTIVGSYPQPEWLIDRAN